MDVYIDWLIALLADLKTQGPVNRLLFVLAVAGPPAAVIYWLRRGWLAKGALAQKQRDEAKEAEAIATERARKAEAEATALRATDPATFQAAFAKFTKDGDNAGLDRISREYLTAIGPAAAQAYARRAERMQGHGLTRLDEAHRYAAGAVAADPQDNAIRLLERSIAEQREQVAKAPTDDAARTTAAERTRLHALIADPGADAMTLNRVAHGEFEKGWYLSAAAIWERALEHVAHEMGSESASGFALRCDIGRARLWGGQTVRAGEVISALPLAAARFGEISEQKADAHRLMGELELHRGDPTTAKTALTIAKTAAIGALGPDDLKTLSIRRLLAETDRRIGEAVEAEKAFTVLLKDITRVSGHDDPHTLATRFSIAEARLDQGDAAGAEAAWTELLSDTERVKGIEHPDTLTTRSYIAQARLDQDDAAGAEAALRELLPTEERVKGADHPHTLTTKLYLARAAVALGRAGEAATDMAALAPVMMEKLAVDHPLLGRLALFQAMAAAGSGDDAAADELIAEAKRIWADRLLPTHSYLREMEAFEAARRGDPAPEQAAAD